MALFYALRFLLGRNLPKSMCDTVTFWTYVWEWLKTWKASWIIWTGLHLLDGHFDGMGLVLGWNARHSLRGALSLLSWGMEAHSCATSQWWRCNMWKQLRWVAGLVSVRIFGHVKASLLNSRTLAERLLSLCLSVQVLKCFGTGCLLITHYTSPIIPPYWNLGQMIHLNCWALHWVQISSTNTARPPAEQELAQSGMVFWRSESQTVVSQTVLIEIHTQLVTLWSPDRLLPLAVLIVPKYYSQGLIPLS